MIPVELFSSAISDSSSCLRGSHRGERGVGRAVAMALVWIEVGLGVAGTACGTGNEISSEQGAGKPGFRDPFHYCRAVGTIDQPDARWAGPKVPNVLVAGMRREGLLGDVPQQHAERGLFWRCMDGGVQVCFVGVNTPCWARADTSRIPSVGMIDFCKANPDSDSIPAVATGRTTIYAWRCTGGEPRIARTFMEPDAQGFPSAFWHPLQPATSL